MKSIKTSIVLFICLMNMGSFAQIIIRPPTDQGPVFTPRLSPNMTAGKYFIKTSLTNRFLDVQGGNPAASTPVQIYDFNGLWAQVWELIPSGEADYFYVKSEMGRYLDVKGGSRASQTDAWIWDFNGGDAQKWRFTPTVAASGYIIQSKLETYLDVSGGATVNGSKVWLYNNAGFHPQIWELQPAGEGNPLQGSVDMHTHPMIHLAFGGHLVYGAADVGSPILPGQRFQGWNSGHTTECNESTVIASSVGEALGNCQAMHGGWGAYTLFDQGNNCGDDIRAEIVNTVDKISKFKVRNGVDIPALGRIGHLDHDHSGYPNFMTWPHFSSVVHQQMWIDWIRRAHEKGNLNVMVALATNNQPLADALKGTDNRTATDDITSGSLQISEIRNLVSRHTDFMEIALNPSDLKKIVRAGKLAIILGIELDDFGNFNKQSNVTAQNVKDRIDYWYNMGVRYAFPIHTIDNKFGGTAIYESSFNYGNRVATGHYWDIKCSLPSDNITARFVPDEVTFLTTKLKHGVTDLPPAAPNCSEGRGHINGLDMQELGYIALLELMKKGIMIDIDHMGQKTATQSLLFGQRNNYPINSGHNGLRGGDEKSRTIDMINLMKETGGMFGVGWGNGIDDAHNFTSTSETFLNNFNGVLRAMNYKNVAIGTDINGLVPTPGPPRPRSGPHVEYNTSFPKCKLGNQDWDYNLVGVAHYGLFPEFIMDIKLLPSGEDAMRIFNKSAEYFAQMWEKCERQRVNVH